ncbi:hypothetical protein HYV91_01155 [Candidatus Wolfebacteria bacterium]|nr:hypothetical protein [Candidatus Wolfebacteria bacterium]
MFIREYCLIKDNLIHYEKLREDFKKLIGRGKLSHSYLFFGGDERDREGKIMFAKSLANFLETGSFEPPTRVLSEFLIIQKNEEGNVGIDGARLIKSFLSKKPSFGPFRTAVVPDAENLTPDAQNSLLKIVEEPPESALIILVARNEDAIFPTLASRLQKIYFRSERNDAFRFRRSLKDFSPDEIIEEADVNDFFEVLLYDLKREPIKNFKKLKEALSRLALMKQFNLNKRLQIRALTAFIRNQ